MMIIGKSLIASSGGLKPEICVTAKAGALLNLHYKDSSIILQSYQLGAEETQHTFIVNVSETAYVIDDATNIVTNSASVEVLVDSVSQYSVKIGYIHWLYKDGEEFKNITGGWSVGVKSYGDELGTVVQNSSNFYLYTPNLINDECPVASNSLIDLGAYSNLFAKFVEISGYPANGSPEFGVCANPTRRGFTGTGAINHTVAWSGSSELVVSVDISQMNSVCYVVAYMGAFDSYPVTKSYLTQVWLE